MYSDQCPVHTQVYTRVKDANEVTKARASVPEELALKLMYDSDSPDFIGDCSISILSPDHSNRQTSRDPLSSVWQVSWRRCLFLARLYSDLCKARECRRASSETPSTRRTCGRCLAPALTSSTVATSSTPTGSCLSSERDQVANRISTFSKKTKTFSLSQPKTCNRAPSCCIGMLRTTPTY